MPTFDSAGAGFSRGFRGGAAIALRKREMEAAKEQLAEENARKDREDYLASVDAMETRADEGLEEYTNLLVEMAPNFGDDDEKFQAVRAGAEATIKGVAVFRQQNRETAKNLGLDEETISLMPDPAEFAKPRLDQLEARIANSRAAAKHDSFELVGPEDLGELGKNLPEGAVLQRNSKGEVKFLFDPTDDADSLESRIQALVESGVERSVAAGIAAGRRVIGFDPVTREFGIFDKATGDQIGKLERPPQDADAEPVVPPGTETSAATGAGGAFRNAVNIVTDAVGGGVVAGKTQEATDALQLVQTTTKLALQVAIPGRPAKDIRDDLQKLTVTPNSLFQGEERSKSRLSQMLRFIDNNIAEKQAALDSGTLSPTDRSLLQNNVRELKQMKEAHEDLLKGFDKDEGVELPDEVEAAVKRALGD